MTFAILLVAVRLQEIDERLYLGDRTARENRMFLEESSIKVVVNVSDSLGPLPPNKRSAKVLYLHFPMSDDASAPATARFEVVCSAVLRVLRVCFHHGWKVLVHCNEGRSRLARCFTICHDCCFTLQCRSASVVLVYAMAYKQFSLLGALNCILAKRHPGLPGEHFRPLLAAAERFFIPAERVSKVWADKLRPGDWERYRGMMVTLAPSVSDRLPAPTSILPPRGIPNLGGSCYAAVVLQLWAAAPPVMDLTEQFRKCEGFSVQERVCAALGGWRIVTSSASLITCKLVSAQILGCIRSADDLADTVSIQPLFTAGVDQFRGKKADDARVSNLVGCFISSV